MPTPIPCLWFNGDAEEAARFYCTIFEDGKVLSPKEPTLVGQRPPFMVNWEMNGQKVMGMNGGPTFPQSECFSFFVSVEDQDELDKYWDALLAGGGTEGMCGWLKDRFGVSWQIVPKQLGEYVGNPDPIVAKAATDAMLKMNKIVLADLQAAAEAAR